MNSCFSRKEETNFENQKGTANDRRLRRQTQSLCCEFSKKKEMRFLLHKSPNQKIQDKKKTTLRSNKSNSFLNRTKPRIEKIGHFIFWFGRPLFNMNYIWIRDSIGEFPSLGKSGQDTHKIPNHSNLFRFRGISLWLPMFGSRKKSFCLVTATL